jgi:hypothetical protein
MILFEYDYDRDNDNDGTILTPEAQGISRYLAMRLSWASVALSMAARQTARRPRHIRLRFMGQTYPADTGCVIALPEH